MANDDLTPEEIARVRDSLRSEREACEHMLFYGKEPCLCLDHPDRVLCPECIRDHGDDPDGDLAAWMLQMPDGIRIRYPGSNASALTLPASELLVVRHTAALAE